MKITIDLSTTDLMFCVRCPRCLWEKGRGHTLPFPDGGLRSHLSAEAREHASSDQDYRGALRRYFGKNLDHSYFTELVVDKPLLAYDKSSSSLLKETIHDCFFDRDHSINIPIAWKSVAGAKQPDEADLIRLHAYGLLFVKNGHIAKKAAIVYMVPNGPHRPWDYQIESVRPSITEALRIQRAAARILRSPNPPTSSPKCERCQYDAAIRSSKTKK